MSSYHWGKKRIEIHNGVPRLFLHEKNERIVRLVLRSLTALGIALSVFSFIWYIALSISISLVVINWFLERTLFYYSSMCVGDMILDYDPDQWVATVIVSIGEPADPRSKKIVGVWMQTQEYARRFFEVLHNWTGTKDNTQGDLRLTFVIDEDMYYVFMYSDPMRESFKKFAEKIKKANELKKYGKEHFPLIMQQVLCKGFETTRGFALGIFLDNNPPGKDFLLAPYITGHDGKPTPADDIDPIYMADYKFKIPDQLDKNDFEYFHWHKIVERKAVGQNT